MLACWNKLSFQHRVFLCFRVWSNFHNTMFYSCMRHNFSLICWAKISIRLFIYNQSIMWEKVLRKRIGWSYRWYSEILEGVLPVLAMNSAGRAVTGEAAWLKLKYAEGIIIHWSWVLLSEHRKVEWGFRQL